MNECHDVSVSQSAQVTGWGIEPPKTDTLLKSGAIFPDETPARIGNWPPGSLTEFKPEVVCCETNNGLSEELGVSPDTRR